MRIVPAVTPSWALGGRETSTSDIDRLSNHWKFHVKLCALSRLALHANLSRVLLDDAVSNREAKARAAAITLLRTVLSREERIVDPVNMFRRDTFAGIAYSDVHGAAVAGRDAKRATFRHRIPRVQEQVQKYLLQLSGITLDRRQP